ncbi:methyl-accepting chemotaxis protein [Alkalicoccus urumqiensis]|uniref:Methyl-accepting transducer domain-containing protein n=1 Tax=Alkalicoccus urumqiensis TaxID=1548213 RepID=A0A2P6MGP4_ALKUR|nr:methyl-accepting chemotaxis protein [Alkalicoccus urumqiensis]PRO65465.1 hypothetical protein C6I21_09930 [Alkalicoccus urumqiensis]
MLGLKNDKLRSMTDEEILQAIAVSAPVFQAVSKDDFMMDIVTKDTWYAHFPGETIDVEVAVGAPIPDDDHVMQSALRGVPQSGRPPYEAYNAHFLGRTEPIRNGRGEVIGAIGIGYNIDQLIHIEENLDQTESALASVNQYIEDIRRASAALEESSSSLEAQTEEVNKSVKNIDGVLALIDKVSSQTNILGLNASIEAARAGEHGRGFSVVADEVRKLAGETIKAAEQIRSDIQTIQSAMKQLLDSFSKVDHSVENNAELVEKFAVVNTKLKEMNENMSTSVRRMLDVS